MLLRSCRSVKTGTCSTKVQALQSTWSQENRRTVNHTRPVIQRREDPPGAAHNGNAPLLTPARTAAARPPHPSMRGDDHASSTRSMPSITTCDKWRSRPRATTESHRPSAPRPSPSDQPGQVSVAVGTAPRPYGFGPPPHRSQRAGLPHWAPTLGMWRRSGPPGQGCITRAGGSHRVAMRPIRSQVSRCRWLRRRSARNQRRAAPGRGRTMVHRCRERRSPAR